MALSQFLLKVQSANFIDTIVEKKCPCSLAHMGLHRASLPNFIMMTIVTVLQDYLLWSQQCFWEDFWVYLNVQICPVLLSSGWILTSSSPCLVKLCNYGTMPKLINPCGNMASLQNRQVSIYLSASGHTNAYLKIHSSPTRKILFTTHMHKYACLYMHPECTEYSCPDIYASVNAEKNPYILAPTKLKTDKQREKIIYSASFNFTLKMSGR